MNVHNTVLSRNAKAYNNTKHSESLHQEVSYPLFIIAIKFSIITRHHNQPVIVLIRNFQQGSYLRITSDLGDCSIINYSYPSAPISGIHRREGATCIKWPEETTISPAKKQLLLMSTAAKLFQPIKVGNLELQHRVVHAPLTRFKATKQGHVQVQPLVKEYYKQRSSTPGTFLLTEATIAHHKAGGYHNVPGIWTDEQIASWKQVSRDLF